eukprot:COSAG06_NODE_42703_length_379_cov_0.832143_1_plen_25_part_01
MSIQQEYRSIAIENPMDNTPRDAST